MIPELISKIQKPYCYIGELRRLDEEPDEFLTAIDRVEEFTNQDFQTVPNLYERRFPFGKPDNLSEAPNPIDVGGYKWKSNSIVMASDFIDEFSVHVHELSHALQTQTLGWNKYVNRWEKLDSLANYPFRKMEHEGFAYWVMNKVGDYDEIEEIAPDEQYDAFQKFIAHEKEHGLKETVERALNPQNQPVTNRKIC